MIRRWVNTGYNYGQAVRLQVCHVGNTDPVGKQLVLQGYTEKPRHLKQRMDQEGLATAELLMAIYSTRWYQL